MFVMSIVKLVNGAWNINSFEACLKHFEFNRYKYWVLEMESPNVLTIFPWRPGHQIHLSQWWWFGCPVIGYKIIKDKILRLDHITRELPKAIHCTWAIQGTYWHSWLLGHRKPSPFCNQQLLPKINIDLRLHIEQPSLTEHFIQSLGSTKRFPPCMLGTLSKHTEGLASGNCNAIGGLY